MGELTVGHGRECITPPLGIRMVGYAARTEGAADVHDDLFVNAVALGDGNDTVAILAYDVCLFRLETAEEIKSAIREETGLEPKQVFLNTSHTHAGPALGHREEKAEDQEQYRADLIRKSVAALRKAMDDMAPATLSVGRAPLDVGCNRRERQEDGEIKLGHNPDGPTLQEVTVWQFARADRPDVILFSTPMHGTTLGGRNLSISAEWMGAAVRFLEEQMPEVRTVFLQGCGANQDPYYSITPEGARGTFDELEQHGRDAAAAVRSALQDMRELNAVPFRTAMRQVPLPGKEDESETRPLPVHGLKMGDAILLALGCEAFVEFAFYGMDASSAKETLVLGYTDGNIGYLCTADAFETGGYETKTTRVAPRSEELTKVAIKEVLAELT